MTGVEAEGFVSNVLVWGIVIPGQTPTWEPVNDAQFDAWEEVNDNQSSIWENVAA